MVPEVGPLAILAAWLNQHPRYSYTAEAYERTPSGSESETVLRISYDATQNLETVHVVHGSGAGSDIRWSGGATVDIRGPGLTHIVSIRLPVRDARLLSPRKNDIRIGDFDRVAQCFLNAGDRVRAASTAQEIVIVLADARGLRCGNDYGDAPITTDRLTLDPADGHPVLRERLNGSTVVERWRIRDLTTG